MIEMRISPNSKLKKHYEILKDFWDFSINKQYFKYSIQDVLKMHDDFFGDLKRFGSLSRKEHFDILYPLIHKLGSVYWIFENHDIVCSTMDGGKRMQIRKKILFYASCKQLSKIALKPFPDFEDWYYEKLNGGTKMLEFYLDEKGSGIRSNAKDEREFLYWASDLIAKMITESFEIEGMDWDAREKEFQKKLRSFLPQIVEICCKYRGYKSNVLEQKVLIMGQILKGKPQYSLNDK